ncbi:MAG: PilZ domain-containing protein [Nitrospirae bacterium]|nr:PilZ domain-containing protein [Nitrospirota bacterium]
MDTFQRRRYPRVNVSLPVEYKSDGKTKRVLAKTVGEGGLMLNLNENLPIETRLNLNLFLPNMSPSSSVLYSLKAKGKIVWVQEEKDEIYCGISFIEIAQNDIEVLSAFINKYREI